MVSLLATLKCLRFIDFIVHLIRLGLLNQETKVNENDKISERDQFNDLIHVHDHIVTQPSTSYDRLVIDHNTPQVPISVEQPIIEVPQIVEDLLVDQQI